MNARHGLVTRRRFIRSTIGGATAVIGAPAIVSALAMPGQGASAKVPWYRRAYLWGQTNITEKDPSATTSTGGAATGSGRRCRPSSSTPAASSPTTRASFPLHHRAEFLGDRDLFGELTKAAHDDGIFVMARMDSNRTDEDFFKAHPDWFARDANGQPYRAADKYVACINSPYYDEYLPDVLREIIERSRPDGFTDNSWAGLGRESICYCDNCTRKFQAQTGNALPRTADWNDQAYRDWIMWSYARRTELWDLNNRTTRAAGGPDCIWSGMNSGSVTAQARSFRDLKEICARADIVMLDHQRRDDDTGFQQNGDTGKRVHTLLGWDKLAPESMAMYQSGPGYYRVASKPAAEARMWMIAGIAGGIQPWWHHVGAYHEDRRMYQSAEPVMRWWKANERYLVERTPIANVGVVWSQRNTDFFGRDAAAERRRRTVYRIHARPRPGADSVSARARRRDRAAGRPPEDADPAQRRRLVGRAGGGRQAVRRARWIAAGDRRDQSLHRMGRCRGRILRSPICSVATGPASCHRRPRRQHAAVPGIRLALLRRARAVIPICGSLPNCARASTDHVRATNRPSPATRHAVLRGFDETDLIAFGGTLGPLKVDRRRAGAADVRPAVSNLPAGDRLDASADDRHSRPRALRTRPIAHRLHARGYRSPLRR